MKGVSKFEVLYGNNRVRRGIATRSDSIPLVHNSVKRFYRVLTALTVHCILHAISKCRAVHVYVVVRCMLPVISINAAQRDLSARCDAPRVSVSRSGALLYIGILGCELTTLWTNINIWRLRHEIEWYSPESQHKLASYMCAGPSTTCWNTRGSAV